MSHETNHGSSSEVSKSIVAFKSSFWLAVIIVGLFVASLNFVQVMGKSEEGKGEKKEGTEEVKTEKPNTESTSPAESAKTDASKTEVANPKPEAPKEGAAALAKEAEHK